MDGSVYLQMGEIDHGSNAGQKVHSKDPIDFEAVVHGSGLDDEVRDAELSDIEAINSLEKYEFATVHASDTMEHVVHRVLQSDGPETVCGKDCSGYC